MSGEESFYCAMVMQFLGPRKQFTGGIQVYETLCQRIPKILYAELNGPFK